jgi:hypothetical protein
MLELAFRRRVGSARMCRCWRANRKKTLQCVQVTCPVAWVGDVGEEGFDVASADEGPVGDRRAVRDEVASQVADGGQVDLEGAVGPRFGSRAACPLP